VYGKILSITKSGAVIRYVYDAGGNRIMKQTTTDTTVYVRDASGNVMSVYRKPAGGALVQTETHLYGSSRLGMATQHATPDTTVVLSGGFGNGIKAIFTRGEKLFELSNHLQNVLVTISDKKIGVDQNSDGTVDYYTADVITANDFYPFGSQMPGRKFAANGLYRYGFNGKENDNEVVQYDYGFRIYDPRLGRFKSVDPLTKQYPFYTPYQFAGNSPIFAIDLDGKEPEVIITNNGKLTEPIIHLLSSVLDYKQSFLRGIRFGWTNEKVKLPDNEFAANLPNHERIVINRFWQDSYVGDSYELFWFNTTVHEIKHKEQVVTLGKDIAFAKKYKDIMEGQAYDVGDAMEQFIRNNKYSNLFDSRWSEKDRIGYADYIGATFKLNNLNDKLERQYKLVDLFKGQLKLLDKGKLITNDAEATRKDLNSKLSATYEKIKNTKSQIKETEAKKEKLETEYSKIINIQYL
jgi:RHS repeat-associated protein